MPPSPARRAAASSFHRRVVSIALLALVLAAPRASAQEHGWWAQVNQDGHGRNAGAQDLAGEPRVRWARALRGFATVDGVAGQRSNNLAVRDGRILLIVPATGRDAVPTTTNTEHRATYGMLSLATGAVVHAALSPQQGGGGLVTGGLMDSDTATGLVNLHWRRDGVAFTGHGSDHPGWYRFDAATGEVPAGSRPLVPLRPALWKSFLNSNSSGWFTMSDADPSVYAIGGGGGHVPIGEYGGTGVHDGAGPLQVRSLKMYAPFVVDGPRVYALDVVDASQDLHQGYGVRISASEWVGEPRVNQQRWTHVDRDRSFLAFGANHCDGAPRAVCLGEDGRIWYYGFRTVGAGIAQAPDFARGMLVAGVRTVDGQRDIDVPIAHDPRPESTYVGWRLARALFPQIAARGDRVVVFQPQQSRFGAPISRAHVFAVDTATRRVAWRRDFAAGAFLTDTLTAQQSSGRYSPEQAVQLVIAGGSAWLVEPSVAAGSLRLRAFRFALADGVMSTTTLDPRDDRGVAIAVPAGVPVALREVAAVDGALVCHVDLGSADQAVVVVDGAAAAPSALPPVAVISAPITGFPVLPTHRDSPAAPTDRFDTGAAIAFSSAGSCAADGGAVACRWDFGDGATSTLAHPTHAYRTWGAAPAVVPRVVTLTVRDAAGRERSAMRTLAIRDVGGARTIELAPTADTWVDETASAAGRVHGLEAALVVGTSATRIRQRAYLRFALPATLGPVLGASLRVYAPPGFSLDNVVAARAVDGPWSETGTSWGGAPAPGRVVGVAGLRRLPPYGFYLDIPIADHVRAAGAGGTVSLALELLEAGGDRLTLDAREGPRPPRLVVVHGDPGYPAPWIARQPTASADGSVTVLGGSALGEAALRYHWELVDGPGSIAFAPNDTNHAKSTSASAASAGPYLVRCVVSDGLRSVASAAVSVSPPPRVAVTIASVANGSSWVLPATVRLTASATATYGGIREVRYYAGGVLVGAATASPFLVEWRDPPVGGHPLTAVAFSASGITATSAVVNIRIASTTNRPPSVALTSPVAAASFTVGAPVALAALAVDDGAIRRVEFLADGALVATRIAPPWQASWNGAASGRHVITARAVDDQGATSTSTAVAIAVEAGAPPPPGDVGPPIIAGVAVSGIASDRATVAWSTDEPADARVEYGPTIAYGSVTPPTIALSVSHQRILTGLLPDTLYHLRVLSRDAAGNPAIGGDVVVRTAAAPPPTSGAISVAISSVPTGMSYLQPATVRLAARASTTSGVIREVRYYADRALIGVATASPYVVEWRDPPVGGHPLTAVAVADDGAMATSPVGHIKVSSAANRPPAVLLTSPTPGAAAVGDVAMTAHAVDDVAVVRVDFYAGTTLVGTSARAPYAARWTAPPPGRHVLSAKAVDTAGAVTTSAGAAITVEEPPPTAPSSDG